MQFKVLPIITLLLLLFSCKFSSGSDTQHINAYQSGSSNLAHYNFEKPDNIIKLSAFLTEISGLSFNSANNNLLAINDEQGLIYELNPTTGEILSQQKFGSTGDYEGVEKVGNNIYIVKSNGDIYKKTPTETVKIETRLSLKNDVEGLGYDTTNKQLLVSCKAKTLSEKDPKGSKAVYSFNLAKEKLNKEPFLLIKRKKVSKLIKNDGGSKKAEDRAKGFSPSGIAVHPITKHVYIVSAVESMMLVYSLEHKPIQCVFFDKSKIPQPEGICFSPDGTLFVSTEGHGTRGRIFVYSSIH
ncbi:MULTISPECIES: SdiA-regulated domain-containing protein [unclassified Saccharicrinis]|uniref:SdiA-regulated domain-containing protein n=1 Tax=unclassified Saccharicrinis TaxID=2646859 RepID=UPI003D3326AA